MDETRRRQLKTTDALPASLIGKAALMRRTSLLAGSVLALALALPALAQADYAGEAQFNKLLPLLGTWTCTDNRAMPTLREPEVWTVTQEGDWVVSQITGTDPATNYKRYSLVLGKYIQVDIRFDIGAEGGASTSETSDSDPLNATWTPSNPFNYPSSYYDRGTSQTIAQTSPEKEAFSGNTLTLTGEYIYQGKITPYKEVCTKS